MRVLLLSGLGPTLKNQNYLAGSLFDPSVSVHRRSEHAHAMLGDFQLSDLHLHTPQGLVQLLRPEGKDVTHLTTLTLRSILERASVDYRFLDLYYVWNDQGERSADNYDVVLLSTSFIWEYQTLRRAVDWIELRHPGATIVLGGQYSNLKYRQILHGFTNIAYLIRGDGEEALPLLLDHIARSADMEDVPNLVMRSKNGEIILAKSRNIDIEAYPSPSFFGNMPVLPYESMRGCPFSCKFCSFPAASPIWRYKSASRIARDWTNYVSANGTSLVKAMDSTFTVPPARFRELMNLLPIEGLRWRAFARADSLKDRNDIDLLEASGCESLSIGFESMSDASLTYMRKNVTAEQNLLAFNLLRDSSIHYKASFMAGYPGETPEEFLATRNFLVNGYSGHFMLSVFSLEDQTMPVWQDAERFQIRLHDEVNPDYAWEHIGMSVEMARLLVRSTLDAVRKHNEKAVLKLWQAQYERPIVPGLSLRQNLSVEKEIERLAMIPIDFVDTVAGAHQSRSILENLAKMGICSRSNCQSSSPAPALRT